MGMNLELGLSSQAFGFAAGLFFIGYFLFEVGRFDGEHWLGAFQQHLLRHAAEQKLAHRAAMADTNHQQFGVVVLHRLEQLFGGVGTDGLSVFELHAHTR